MIKKLRGCVIVIVAGTCLEPLGAQDPSGPIPGIQSILYLDIENYTTYFGDVTDASKLATDPNPTQTTAARTFATFVGVADIVRINGQAVKGTWTVRAVNLNLSPSARRGETMADVGRTCVMEWIFEILHPDGQPIGTIVASGLGGGPPPPGSAAAASRTFAGNLAITGGTGVYLGVKGQVAVSRFWADPREASATEDPSFRRRNGGGAGTFALHVIPIQRPGIHAGPPPWVFHMDWTTIGPTSPAKPGEVLQLIAGGFGPVRAILDPGELYPEQPAADIVAPVEVLINGRPCEILVKSGGGAMINVFYLRFKVPEDTLPGLASITVTAAWLKGPVYTINIARP